MNLREKEEYKKQLEILLEALIMVPSEFTCDHTEAPMESLVNYALLNTVAFAKGDNKLALNILLRSAKKLAIEMKIAIDY